MKKIRFLLRYISYLAKSTNEHGVHSPFVFNLLTKVIKDKKRHEDYQIVENIREELLRDKRTISVTDFGAGSTYSDSKKRTVSSIARNAAKSKKYGRLLYRFVNHFQPKNILELGTSLGISTMYIATANKGIVTTVEGCSECLQVAKENFKKAGLTNIQAEVGNFDEVLPRILKKQEVSFDFVFIDGNHRKEPTLNYFNQCVNHMKDNSMIIFDDIHWSEEMEVAWKEIKSHPKVTVTIDLFFIGIVFFRASQRKQDFILRF